MTSISYIENPTRVLHGAIIQLNLLGLNRDCSFENKHHARAYMAALKMEELLERPDKAGPIGYDVTTGEFVYPFDTAIVEFTEAIEMYQQQKNIFRQR